MVSKELQLFHFKTICEINNFHAITPSMVIVWKFFSSKILVIDKIYQPQTYSTDINVSYSWINYWQ